jgi:CheY-like chemotaxis protein
MEAVGNLSGGIAHDFNNLLTIIIGNLDLLQFDVAGNPPAEQKVAAILQASERGADLTRQMLAFSRRQPLQRKKVAINKLVEETIRLLQRTLGGEIAVDMRLASDVGTVITDPQQFGSALVNLAVNARDAMPSGGTLSVATRKAELDAAYADTHPEVKPGLYACVEVSDTGVGMSPELTRRVFEPFFTTKPTGKGTGLGLSMVYGFMKQTEGHVSVYSEVGHGTTFRMYIPLEEANDAAAPARDPGPPAEPTCGEMILVVDDDARVRTTVVAQLKQLGYRILEADNARSALAILDGPIPVDLLLTDVIMPGGMNGKELGTEARRKHPRLRVLFTSGFPGTSLTGTDFDRDDVLLSKPYRKAELARAVRGVLDAQTHAAAH